MPPSTLFARLSGNNTCFSSRRSTTVLCKTDRNTSHNADARPQTPDPASLMY